MLILTTKSGGETRLLSQQPNVCSKTEYSIWAHLGEHRKQKIQINARTGKQDPDGPIEKFMLQGGQGKTEKNLITILIAPLHVSDKKGSQNVDFSSQKK